MYPKKLVSFSTWIDHTRWARNTWAMAAIFILSMADTIDMVSWCSSGRSALAGTEDDWSSASLQLSCGPPESDPRSTTPAPAPSGRASLEGCWNNPKYYSYVAVLALMATTMLVQVSHMVKLTLMLLITVTTGVVNIYSWRSIFDRYDAVRFKEYR